MPVSLSVAASASADAISARSRSTGGSFSVQPAIASVARSSAPMILVSFSASIADRGAC